MAKRNHHIKVELKIHAITCPGVWLCQSGDVELTIDALDYAFRAPSLPPRFPLLYHESFTMEGYFTDSGNFLSLEDILANETIDFTMWQNGRRLAYYSGKIKNLLRSQNSNPLSMFHSHNDLIMSPASCFPGTIAPKLEVSVQIEVQEICHRCENSYLKRYPKSTRTGNAHSGQRNGVASKWSFKHQRPVCHAPNYSTEFRRNNRNGTNSATFIDECNKNGFDENMCHHHKQHHSLHEGQFHASYCTARECAPHAPNEKNTNVDLEMPLDTGTHVLESESAHIKEKTFDIPKYTSTDLHQSKKCKTCQTYRKYFNINCEEYL